MAAEKKSTGRKQGTERQSTGYRAQGAGPEQGSGRRAQSTGKARKTGAAEKAAEAKAPRPTGKKKVAAGNDLAPERVAEILRILAKTYPNAECALVHRNAWELLVATILSAQCTDARVNMVTPELFRTFPGPKAMAAASLPAIEEIIRSTGFYHNKAKSILGAAKKIVSDFGGKVPQTMAELLTVPGAARKTANVVLGVAYRKAEGVVVDTHVLRISNRLGLTHSDDPKKVEQELMQILPHDRWIAFSHEVIHHGRNLCVARKPKCVDCPLERLCHAPDKTWESGEGRD
ncbi:endonuclease III [Acidipila sp. 4G-K13]|uniref:Endonuclease III n=2 Tax=Paracidobacterium acidisoli TaxID=2303751 RepID=A0A372IT12_9BACT|nr:endonuclease III [Paracidobacterium acidisoli]